MPELNCISDEIININFKGLIELYKGETVAITDDLAMEGYVVSSDKEGNFYASLHIQDKPNEPEGGIQLDIDLNDSYLTFPPGSRVIIKLKGLYLGKRGDVFRLGGAFMSFGNLGIGRLPAPALAQHLYHACNPGEILEPHPTSTGELNDEMLNTLISLPGMQLQDAVPGITYASPEETILHVLEDCKTNGIYLKNSGYSNFWNRPMPLGNGQITAVLLKEGKKYELVIRDTTDLDFSGPRCSENSPDQQSNSVFISEIADPDNNADARFIELFNAGKEELSLNNWVLQRFTNENTLLSSTIDLGGLRIQAESTLVIAADALEFEAIYGFPAHLEGGHNSPADSNGDDNIILVDPSGTVIDSFGVVGEDGSGTNHEFEDGRALRRPEVVQANPVYTFSEWDIYNDSGQEGTQNLPRNAPQDFNPGIHQINQ